MGYLLQHVQAKRIKKRKRRNIFFGLPEVSVGSEQPTGSLVPGGIYSEAESKAVPTVTMPESCITQAIKQR